MEHLVEEDVLDDESRDTGAVHAAIQYDLIGAGIVAAKLAAPGAAAPADVWPSQHALKVALVQFVKHLGEVEVEAGRTGWRAANPPPAHTVDTIAGAVGTRVFEIRRHQDCRRFAAVDATQKKSGGSFQNGERCAAEQVRQADEDLIFAAPNGENQTSVGVKLYVKAGRTPFAAKAREDALEQRRTAGKAGR